MKLDKLLIFVDWFLPGYKAGGQIQSCANLAFALKDRYEIYIVTTDRDMGDVKAFPSVNTDQWTALDRNIKVNYLSPFHRDMKSIRDIIKAVNPDCIYLNSMYSFSFTLLPIRVNSRLMKSLRIVLAPRGMLHQGALKYKSLKKHVFFIAFKWYGYHKRLTFHATDVQEQADIKKIFGSKVLVKLVKDFPAPQQATLSFVEKKSGQLNCLFVSRISPKKNLLFLLSMLKAVHGDIELSIVGPVEDEDYWLQCKKLIAKLPSNVKTRYLGSLRNDELPAIYRQSHLFILPTFGENFGHVIFESLSNGRPVLISINTPWRELHMKEIGWDIPLSDQSLYSTAIDEAAAWDQHTFDRHCTASWNYACQYIHESNLKEEYIELFQ